MAIAAHSVLSNRPEEGCLEELQCEALEPATVTECTVDEVLACVSSDGTVRATFELDLAWTDGAAVGFANVAIERDSDCRSTYHVLAIR